MDMMVVKKNDPQKGGMQADKVLDKLLRVLHDIQAAGSGLSYLV